MAIFTIDKCFCEIKNGANIKQGIVDGGYPITRIETISDNKFNRDRMGYAGIFDLSKYKDYILSDGDLLMSHINSPKYLGRTVMYKSNGNEKILHGMNLLRLKVYKDVLNPAYAELLFYSPAIREQIRKVTKKSVNQASFSVSDLKKIEVDIPSMNEQIDVVKKINKLKKNQLLKKETLHQLDLLIKARFVEMFGSIHESTEHPYFPLRELTNIISGGTPSRENKEYWVNGNIPWVKTTELKNNLITDTEEYITGVGLKNSSAKLVQAGTVLIAMYGQGKTRGMTGYLTIEATTNQACACILPSKKIDSMFLWKYLELSYDKLRSLAQGAGQPNLNGNMIKEFNVIVPPISLQNQFADFVAQVDKSKLHDIRQYRKKML